MTSAASVLYDPVVQQTVAALRVRFQGSPWTVVQDEQGVVRVAIDLADTSWWEVLQRQGLSTSFTFELRFRPDRRSCTITDVERTLVWSVGFDGRTRPQAVVDRKSSRGRTITFRRTVVDTPLEGRVVDVSFGSEDVRKVVREVLTDYGWRETMPIEMKIGIGAGIIGVAVAAGAVVVAALVGTGALGS
ncbi:hypothetical protein ACFWFR_14230 [Oerskovia sp. NPDC060287]|uniref:hypothetical protein n=1 Tax=Oerskovia sp. NPDC060287 TaxID=3347095 RepID=UPI0036495AA9